VPAHSRSNRYRKKEGPTLTFNKRDQKPVYPPSAHARPHSSYLHREEKGEIRIQEDEWIFPLLLFEGGLLKSLPKNEGEHEIYNMFGELEARAFPHPPTPGIFPSLLHYDNERLPLKTYKYDNSIEVFFSSLSASRRNLPEDYYCWLGRFWSRHVLSICRISYAMRPA
jgi:hypothetical protein